LHGYSQAKVAVSAVANRYACPSDEDTSGDALTYADGDESAAYTYKKAISDTSANATAFDILSRSSCCYGDPPRGRQ
jgi:hypothetical protein